MPVNWDTASQLNEQANFWIIDFNGDLIMLKPEYWYREKRCVVPAGEYFEWQGMGKKHKKKKHHAKDKDGNILYMAGLYRDTPDGREYVIITKESYGEVTKIHDRISANINQVLKSK